MLRKNQFFNNGLTEANHGHGQVMSLMGDSDYMSQVSGIAIWLCISTWCLIWQVSQSVSQSVSSKVTYEVLWVKVNNPFLGLLYSTSMLLRLFLLTIKVGQSGS